MMRGRLARLLDPNRRWLRVAVASYGLWLVTFVAQVLYGLPAFFTDDVLERHRILSASRRFDWVGNSLLVIGAIAILVEDTRVKRRKRRLDAGRCANCGYDLRASPDRCPECGTPAK